MRRGRTAGRRDQARISFTTSPSLGKRFRAFLEKTSLPSTVTSNRPPPAALSLGSTESSRFSSAASLAA